MSIDNEAEVIESEAHNDTITPETDDETESAPSAPAEEGADSRTETPEQRNARLKRQVEREAKKSGLSVEEYLGISRETRTEGKEVETGDDRYHRLELKTEGIRDRAEQDIVLDYINHKKVDVETALKSAAVKAELREFRERASTPSPSSRTAPTEKSVEWWARQVENGKPNSNDPIMRKKVRDFLQKKLT